MDGNSVVESLVLVRSALREPWVKKAVLLQWTVPVWCIFHENRIGTAAVSKFGRQSNSELKKVSQTSVLLLLLLLMLLLLLLFSH